MVDSEFKVAPIIFGTAGHVDHGKTSLVTKLTKFNTDRHPEEQKRGMSIDFAVAPYTTKDNITIGIVDVPGHEDFIKNAVAGSSSIEVVLLVVAADDGIMPQTREHLQIAKHLGARLIIPVITKIDLVDPDFITIIKEEIESELEKLGFKSTPVHQVSNTNNIGFEALREEIDTAVHYLEQNFIDSKKCFRMFVRSAFNSKGHGSIVTGVPISGKLSVGENLEFFPANIRASQQTSCNVLIKAIQNYKHTTTYTQAHISSAVNIKDVDHQMLTRGSVLASPKIYKPSSTILCWLKNDCGKIKRGKTFFIHVGTLSIEGIINPLVKPDLLAGEEGPAQIRFKSQVVLAAGDRLVIRTNKTIGGGVLLSREGKLPRKSFREHLISGALVAKDVLLSKNTSEISNLISELSTTGPLLISKVELKSLSESIFTNEHLDSLALIKVGKDLWINNYRRDYFICATESILKRYHREKPLTLGIQANHFFKLLISSKDFALVLEEKLLREALESMGEFKVKNGMISLASFAPKFNETELRQVEKISGILSQSKFIAKQNLVSDLSITEKELSILIKLLESERLLRSIGGHVFSLSFLNDLKTSLKEKFADRAFNLAEFRELTGLSRNIAVLILEHFDSEGTTKRSGDLRRV